LETWAQIVKLEGGSSGPATDRPNGLLGTLGKRRIVGPQHPFDPCSWSAAPLLTCYKLYKVLIGQNPYEFKNLAVAGLTVAVAGLAVAIAGFAVAIAVAVADLAVAVAGLAVAGLVVAGLALAIAGLAVAVAKPLASNILLSLNLAGCIPPF
jgi:hypothetical protein